MGEIVPSQAGVSGSDGFPGSDGVSESDEGKKQNELRRVYLRADEVERLIEEIQDSLNITNQHLLDATDRKIVESKLEKLDLALASVKRDLRRALRKLDTSKITEHEAKVDSIKAQVESIRQDLERRQNERKSTPLGGEPTPSHT